MGSTRIKFLIRGRASEQSTPPSASSNHNQLPHTSLGQKCPDKESLNKNNKNLGAALIIKPRVQLKNKALRVSGCCSIHKREKKQSTLCKGPWSAMAGVHLVLSLGGGWAHKGVGCGFSRQTPLTCTPIPPFETLPRCFVMQLSKCCQDGAAASDTVYRLLEKGSQYCLRKWTAYLQTHLPGMCASSHDRRNVACARATLERPTTTRRWAKQGAGAFPFGRGVWTPRTPIFSHPT